MRSLTNFKRFASMLFCLISAYAHGQTERPEYVPGQILVKMKADKTSTQKNILKNEMQATLRRTRPNSRIEVWQTNKSNIDQLISQYRDHPDIEFIEPNYYYYLTTKNYTKADKQAATTPNDILFHDLSNMNNTGQNGGTPDADIDASEGWDIATGSPSIVVGLIDTGVDWKHPDLVNNIWQNLAEDADGDGRVLEWNGTTWIFDPDDTNGIDDDGNGYIDDLIGWDFINKDNDPFDIIGHGTHVAGTLGAEGNNGIGVAGVTWDVQIAALRVFAQQNTSVDIIAEALDYAVMMNMPISNNSYAEGHYAQTMISSLQAAEANEHLFVAAAGNFVNDNDANPHYPSSYDFENIIIVAATDRNDLRWVQSTNRGSSYGATSVDIAAPGAYIKSTTLTNTYGYNTGTSMATPHVTGACALLWEQNPSATYAEIKTALLNSVDVLPDLAGKCVSEGRLNLYGVLTYINTAPPSECRYTDSLALVALYNSTNGANWTNTWDLNQPMDTWYGVTFDGDGCVTCLDLDGNLDCNHFGDTGNNLVGTIPPELGGLASLTWLGLAFNQLSGSIPPELGNLTNLVTGCNLSHNPLTGNIPPELGNLINLENLSLNNCQLSGSIPPELGNMTDLVYLFIHDNQLSGCYPENLSNLCNQLSSSPFNTNTQISDGNNFDAPWEDFCNTGAGTCDPYSPCRQSDSLTLLTLYNSTNGANWTNTWNLNQPMDIWYGITLDGNGCVNCIDMDGTFDCDYFGDTGNNLTGNIPPELGNLNELSYLSLSHNPLTGTIPPQLSNLSNLKELRLYNNNQLSGSIPPELGGLGSLTHLALSSDLLTGTIPSELANLSNLKHLFLQGNDLLTGNIPPEFGNLSNLEWLYLQGNKLTGTIPPELGNLSKLKRLSVAYNSLTGSIPPQLGNLSNLEQLYLNDCQLSGNIPPELGNLSKLIYLYADYNNQLTGNIPPQLGNLSNLIRLYLSGNQLSGSIPAEFGNLSNLERMSLFNNQLSGCYDENLRQLCSSLDPIYSVNARISNGNNFDAPWEDFCNTGLGSCTDLVWPGDYDYNGKVNAIDALYWGLAFGYTGPIRPNATTGWQGQDAPDWAVSVENINSKHQDGTGDGIVDRDDLPVVVENFEEIRNHTQSVYIASTLLYELVEAGPVSGDPSYDLYVTDVDGNNISAHGLSGVLDFGELSIAEVILRDDNSSLEPSDTLKVFDDEENRFHFALTRTDGVNQLCDGPVANFIVVTQDIPVGDPFAIDLENGSIIEANGNHARAAKTTLYTNYPPNIAGNDLMISACVIHQECNIPGSVALAVEGGTLPYNYFWNTGATSSNITELTPNIYEVTVTDAANTSKTLSVEVQGEYITIPDASGNLPDCINSPCPTLVTPGGSISTGTYKAMTVNTDGKVSGTVEFKAEETIILREGFAVPVGKGFSATIEACEGEN